MGDKVGQNLSAYRTPRNFRGRSKFIVQLWWTTYAIFFRLSPQILYGWRRFLLRLFGARVGKNVLIRPSAKITYPWKVTLGNYCWIGDEVVLYSLGEIIIGDNSVISQRSYICTGSHNYSKSSFPIIAKKIVIERNCWIATDVFVAPGITIKEGVVVGSRSSVLKDLPPYSICVGNPAKKIKDRIIEA